MPRSILQRLVVRAKLRLSLTKSPWTTVHGPTAAFATSALRLNWTIHDALRVPMDSGASFHFTLDYVVFVKHAICQSLRRWRWRVKSRAFVCVGVVLHRSWLRRWLLAVVVCVLVRGVH